MPEMTLLNEIIISGGAIGVVTLFAAYLIKVFIAKMSEGSLSIKSNNTQIELINALSKEIDRIRSDFDEMRDEYAVKISNLEKLHDNERLNWSKKLESLENRFDFLRRKNESMRNEALEAYTYISIREDLFKSIYATELKERLMRIIANDVDATSND